MRRVASVGSEVVQGRELCTGARNEHQEACQCHDSRSARRTGRFYSLCSRIGILGIQRKHRRDLPHGFLSTYFLES